jgi:hypothetical protein
VKAFLGHAARLRALEARHGEKLTLIRVVGGLPEGWKPPTPEEREAMLVEAERLRDQGNDRIFRMPKPSTGA